MAARERQKGIILFIVICVTLIIFAGIAGLLFVLDANYRGLRSIKERTQAFYLCEVGASVAIMDITNGCIGTAGNTGPACRIQDVSRWTSNEFDYPMGDRTHRIKYTVTKIDGAWQIVSEVGPSEIFHRVYKLRLGAKMTFPLFIRGRAGG